MNSLHYRKETGTRNDGEIFNFSKEKHFLETFSFEKIIFNEWSDSYFLNESETELQND